MGLIAYSILGFNKEHEEVKKAIMFIEKNIDKKESCEGLAYYILARTKLGMEVEKKLYDRLLKYQLRDGSFKHLKRSSKGNYMASWHGLLAVKDYKDQSSIFTRLHDFSKVKNEKNSLQK
jgi:hypothetical protein